MAQLIFNNTDGPPTVHETGESCTVGRHPDNTIVLDHVSVSGHHAELLIHNGSYLLKDLISSNGTYVNGHKIMVQHLENGDKVRFGKVDATISIETVAEAPVPIAPPPFLNVPGDRE